MKDDPKCAKCGHPRSNHPYRHPFVGPTRDDTMADQQDRLTALEAERDALREQLATARSDALEEAMQIYRKYAGDELSAETHIRADIAEREGTDQ